MGTVWGKMVALNKEPSNPQPLLPLQRGVKLPVRVPEQSTIGVHGMEYSAAALAPPAGGRDCYCKGQGPLHSSPSGTQEYGGWGEALHITCHELCPCAPTSQPADHGELHGLTALWPSGRAGGQLPRWGANWGSDMLTTLGLGGRRREMHGTWDKPRPNIFKLEGPPPVKRPLFLRAQQVGLA